MNGRTILITLLAFAGLVLIAAPVLAQTVNGQTVVYQTSFDSDPHWTTNNPSNDYWDPTLAMYHFSLEPSTGNYAYVPVDYDRGSFTLEYDVIINRIDSGTTFRLGFSGAEMDRNKGPNVLTEFTNAKYGQIMWIRLVTPGNQLVQANSEHAATELEPGAYEGPTEKYELNRTYHVAVSYDDNQKILGVKVDDKVTGSELWGYYVNTAENLHGMNRIYIGSVGDYGVMGTYAQGYIDNVRLSVPPAATPAPTTGVPAQTTTATPAPARTTAKPTTAPAAPQSTPTQSPLPATLVIGSLGIAAFCLGRSGTRKE
ncbi:MAG TPA: hypothetical protein VLY83_02235 [Methanoregula sp.]|nr:hypothetical protein [Methanoregula sp.]